MKCEEIVRVLNPETCVDQVATMCKKLPLTEVVDKLKTIGVISSNAVMRAYEDSAWINPDGSIECPYCGKKLVVLPKYCPSCGQHIKNGSENVIDDAYQKGREDVLEEVEKLTQRIAEISKEMKK